MSFQAPERDLHNELNIMVLNIQSEPPPLVTLPDGVVRITGTRVSIDTIVLEHLGGRTPAEIAESYPSVPLASVYAVIAYYLTHQEQVDSYLRHRETRAQIIREECEARFGKGPTREEMLERWRRKFGAPFPHRSHGESGGG